MDLDLSWNGPRIVGSWRAEEFGSQGTYMERYGRGRMPEYNARARTEDETG